MSGELAIGGLASGLDTNSIIEQLMDIERKPLDRLKEKQETLTMRKSLIQEINRKALSLQQSAFDLTLRNAFQKMNSTSTSSSVATGFVSSSDVEEATYELDVTKLAQSHRVASSRQSAASTNDDALGINGGTFRLNDIDITVNNDFSLNDIAKAINTSGAGVTASIMDKTLLLTSNDSGKEGAIVAEDVSGDTVLSDIGLIQASATNLAATSSVVSSSEQVGFEAANLIDGNTATNWIAQDADKATDITPVTLTMDLGSSQTFNNVVLSQVTGAQSPNYHSGNFTVEVSTDGVNFTKVSEGSLEDIDGDQQSVTFDSVDAQYVRVSVTSEHDQGGEIESQGLSEIGVYNNAFNNELKTAQDAEFTVDGLAVERSSNRVDDLVDGLVISLEGQGLTYLTVEKDLDNTVSIVGSFVNQYNSLMTMIHSRLSEEEATDEQLASATSYAELQQMKQQGLLKRDMLLQDIQSKMKNMISGSVANLVVADVGINAKGFEGGSMTEEGKIGIIEFDAATFQDALKANPDKVEALFANRGGVNEYVESFETEADLNTLTLANMNITEDMYLTVDGQRLSEVADVSQFDAGNGVDEFYLNHNTGEITFENTVLTGSKLEARYSYIDYEATRMSVDNEQFATGNGGTTVFYLGNRYIRENESIEVDGVEYERVADLSMLSASNQYYLDRDRGRVTFFEAPADGAAITAKYDFLVGNNGIANAISDELKRMTGMGAFYNEEVSLETQLSSTATSIIDLEARLQSREDSLWQEFARLESAMSDITSQGQWLSSQLGSLPGFTK